MNILTRSFSLKKDISAFFIYEIYTLSIDFYVKYIYFKIILKNLLAMLLLLLRSMEYLKIFPIGLFIWNIFFFRLLMDRIP